MITIVYPYRDRPVRSIKNSLDSLKSQSKANYNVLFINYGSNNVISVEVKLLTASYDFVTYYYLYTKDQPWNKSKALNFALRHLVQTAYFFVADIDMIFSPKFSLILSQLIVEKPLQNVFFKVGFLLKSETYQNKEFQDFKVHFQSTKEATGLTLFHTDSLKKLNGFDEFYHFWGSEDTDAHVRLQNAGCKVFFYDSEILMLHQWHPSYRSKERKVITPNLQLSGVVQLNHQHLKDAIAQKRTEVNNDNWGISISEQEYELLQKPERRIQISNQKPEIDHFLHFTLKHRTTVITEYVFQLDVKQGTWKQRIKKGLGKKVPQYYSLKEINDSVLLHLISTPEIKNYSCQIAPDLKSISLIF